MNTVAERMQWLREQWGMSARALSLSLGLNNTSWGVYESGSSYPGGQVLTVLAAKHVDINWLLTGNGGPWRNAVEEDLKDVLAQAEAAENRSLGIGELMMKATRSNISVRTQICETIHKCSPAPVTFAHIIASVLSPKQEVIFGLMELIKQNRVEVVTHGGTEKYRLCNDIIENNPVSEAECAALVLDGIRFLATDIREGVEKTPSEAVMWSALISADDGESVLANLKTAFFSVGKNVRSGSQNVKVIVAAKIG